MDGIEVPVSTGDLPPIRVSVLRRAREVGVTTVVAALAGAALGGVVIAVMLVTTTAESTVTELTALLGTLLGLGFVAFGLLFFVLSLTAAPAVYRLAVERESWRSLVARIPLSLAKGTIWTGMLMLGPGLFNLFRFMQSGAW